MSFSASMPSSGIKNLFSSNCLRDAIKPVQLLNRKWGTILFRKSWNSWRLKGVNSTFWQKGILLLLSPKGHFSWTPIATTIFKGRGTFFRIAGASGSQYLWILLNVRDQLLSRVSIWGEQQYDKMSCDTLEEVSFYSEVKGLRGQWKCLCLLSSPGTAIYGFLSLF